MKRTTANWVLALLLLGLPPSGAWAQSAAPVSQQADILRFEAARVLPHSPGLEPLPDAPTVQPPTPIEKFQVFVEDATSPLTFGAAGVSATLLRESQEHLPPGAQSSYFALYSSAIAQKESSAFFGKYLYPSLLKQDPRYHPSTSESFWGRTGYAASRLLITRNDAGHSTVNTSYLLGVLTSVAVASAYRPYWKMSGSETFANFGSTIGSDAGMNLFREFWPGIHRKLEGRTPRFVQKIQKAVHPDSNPDSTLASPRQ